MENRRATSWCSSSPAPGLNAVTGTNDPPQPGQQCGYWGAFFGALCRKCAIAHRRGDDCLPDHGLRTGGQGIANPMRPEKAEADSTWFST